MPTISGIRRAYERGHYIRVVNYHSTPYSTAPALERELASYADQFSSVSVQDLDRFFDSGRWHKDKPGLLPVFYEGYRNSVDVAAPICEALGLTGWFPIATAFVDCPEDSQEAFARSHSITLAEEDTRGGRIAMSWDEVADIATRHVVAPHTAHHEGYDTVFSAEDLRREVLEPKIKLEAVTGRPADAFAWLHGTSYGRSAMHDAAVRDAGYEAAPDLDDPSDRLRWPPTARC